MDKMKVAIIDFEMGNLFSVINACKQVGIEVVVTSDKRVLMDSAGVILPGVGAFGRAMDHLKELDLLCSIRSYIQKGNPFMGICLGMQLLFSQSEEFGISDGINVIKGKVRKFPNKKRNNEDSRVPQIGWNQVFKSSPVWDNSPLKTLRDGEFMYFVHSYYVDSFESDSTLTTTRYGDTVYCSSVLKDNVFATQFHPEKSAVSGIEIYRNWAENIKKNSR